MSKMLTPEQVKDILSDAVYRKAEDIVQALLHNCTKCPARATAEALIQAAGLDAQHIIDFVACTNGHHNG